MWDIKSNLNLEPGRCGCSLSLDALLTPDGDLAIVTGDEELRQRFIIYRATPKGERLDPNLGCTEFDYLHEKNTARVLRGMEVDIQNDMEYMFPEIKYASVLCDKWPDDEYRIKIMTVLSQGNLEFLFNPRELMTISSQLDAILHQTF